MIFCLSYHGISAENNTNAILRLRAINASSKGDISAMRDTLNQLITNATPEAVPVLLNAYYFEKKHIHGNELPILIVKALGAINNNAAKAAILKIAEDIRRQGSKYKTYKYMDVRYIGTLYEAMPFLMDYGKQGLDELYKLYKSPESDWWVRVESKKYILLAQLQHDKLNLQDKVKVLVSQLTRNPPLSWFSGNPAAIDNKAVMRALQSLGVGAIPYIREEAKNISIKYGKDDFLAAELLTLTNIMKQAEALRIKREKLGSKYVPDLK